ncbi:hypothetical protein [Yoonia maritima]|uniref:hypothetical protein n=1 Tax=Yoonia maritima TaxID=1435347 RepID=UPI0037353F3C
MFKLSTAAATGAATIAIAVLPHVALADTSGEISLGHLETDAFRGGYLFGDFVLSVAEGDWGAELGMFGVVGRLHETYASAIWTREGHKVELGFPQPAYDRYAVSGLTQLMPRLALSSISTSRSRATAGVMTESEFLPYGAVYSRREKNARASMSLHGVPDTDIVIFGAGATFEAGAWTVDLAAEAVSEDAQHEWNAKAQVRKEFEDWRIGANIFAADANGAARTAELFAQFDIFKDAELTGQLRKSEGQEFMVGAGVEHDFGRGVTAEFAMVRAADTGLAVSAAVSYSF